MSEKKTDWFARMLGSVGAITGIFGLVLSHHSYKNQKELSQWQRSVQEDSLKEKFQDNVYLSGKLAPIGSLYDYTGRVKMQIEIVNIGQSKVFVKQVEMFADGDRAIVEPIGNKPPPWALEPRMNLFVSVRDWNFRDHPLGTRRGEDDPFKVIVTTTKDTYELEGHMPSHQVGRDF